MLCREINAVCIESHTKRINALRGQNVEFVNVKPDGTNGFSLFSLFLPANNWVAHHLDNNRFLLQSFHFPIH
jgi:hypothetical protein